MDIDNASNTNNNQPKKIKLRTSLDIYHRLLHDFTLGIDLNNVYIGYLDKYLYKIGKSNSEIIEVCILKWVMIDKGGDIPMHHILYFKYKHKNISILLWDRKTRLDRLFGSGKTKDNERFCNLKNTMLIEIQKTEEENTNENETKIDININENVSNSSLISSNAIYFTHAKIVIIGGAICVDLEDVINIPGNTEYKHMTILWRSSPKFTNDDILYFEEYEN